MAKTSYLRFNPDIREIEIEGSEEFIKTYFDKLQQMLPPTPSEVKNEPEAAITSPAKRTKIKTTVKAETLAPKKVVKVAGNKAVVKKSKKVSLINRVVGLVNESGTGTTLADLRDKTGMAPKQINALASRAARLGRIKATKRGVYVPV